MKVDGGHADSTEMVAERVSGVVLVNRERVRHGVDDRIVIKPRTQYSTLINIHDPNTSK